MYEEDAHVKEAVFLHNPSKIFSIIKNQRRKDEGGAFFSSYKGWLLLIIPSLWVELYQLAIDGAHVEAAIFVVVPGGGGGV